jgi:hypothetical protein
MLEGLGEGAILTEVEPNMTTESMQEKAEAVVEAAQPAITATVATQLKSILPLNVQAIIDSKSWTVDMVAEALTKKNLGQPLTAEETEMVATVGKSKMKADYSPLYVPGALVALTIAKKLL